MMLRDVTDTSSMYSPSLKGVSLHVTPVHLPDDGAVARPLHGSPLIQFVFAPDVQRTDPSVST